MSYSSPWYLFFLIVVLAGYAAVPLQKRWAVLLAASYIFFCLASSYLLVFLLISTVSVYASGLILNRLQDNYEADKEHATKEQRKDLKKLCERKKKYTVLAAVCLNLGLLFFLKYYNFFVIQNNELLETLDVNFSFSLRKLFIPLGISFYTLQGISYVIDVSRGSYRAAQHLGKVALFMSFFPQVVEGPIANYGKLGEQLYTGHRFTRENLLRGTLLILWGCFKKIVVADRAAPLVSTVFDNAGQYSGLTTVVATLVYTLQLYADFSGCIDIAIGSARLFGIEFSPNFRQPFFARSATEFWRRWHISLTVWFKDYVFYTVSLSKPFMNFSCRAQIHLGKFIGSLIPAASAMFLVWLGTGLWHGASWKYIAYGLYYFSIIFIGMLLEPVWNRLLQHFNLQHKDSGLGWLRLLRTFILINIGMMLFRANTCTDFLTLFESMFHNVSLTTLTNGSLLKLGLDGWDFVILILGAAGIMAVDMIKEKGYDPELRIPASGLAVQWTVYGMLIISILLFGAYGAAYAPVDFIYAQF